MNLQLFKSSQQKWNSNITIYIQSVPKRLFHS
ncbi:unnamed protein product [Larinioides sclopetarius]|uniref:Uncharacterized protein n=1 Tax=Larinioides sclopetarius TaxID=280406 RepID=A0AAV2A4K6_9ARAC